MPTWAITIVATSVVIGAIITIWTKLIVPAAEVITTSRELTPLLREVLSVFGGDPSSLKVLNEIAGQFRTDSGSSLRDVVNRLEKTAAQNTVNVEVLHRLLGGLDEKMIVGIASTARVEADLASRPIQEGRSADVD